MRKTAFGSCTLLAFVAFACSGSNDSSTATTSGGTSMGTVVAQGGALGGGTGIVTGSTTGGTSLVEATTSQTLGGTSGSVGGAATSTANGGSTASTSSSASSGGSTSSTGGTKATGGSTSSTGGTKATGGASSTGGKSSGTGGTTAGTGGTKATGGASSLGGASSTGGTKATGGTSSTGGSSSVGGASSTWKQCGISQTLPSPGTLKIDPGATGYTTAVDAGGLVVMLMGSTPNACITNEVAKRDVAFLDSRLREVVELAGFPAFPEWSKGYYLNWVILNSGIPGKTLPDEGGHQGQAWGHMNFESTYTCPCVWDDYQSGGALHECVHALQSELWKYNNQASGWIHEAHNNYLTGQTNALARKKYTMGGAASLMLQMPHVPLESMGLNTDDSVAGPADQNAKTYVSTQVRYAGEIFFLSLSQTMGRGFVNCLWMDPPTNNSKSVFQVLQGIAGEAGVANAIMTFAAKTAILDFGEWTTAVRDMMRGSWNTGWWFYTIPSGDGTTAFRPPTKNIPHHQGRNVIPIKVNSGATSVTVEFTPDAVGSKGTAEKMQAQLVYRDTSDKPVYGTVFSSGQNTIQIPGGARGGIVTLAVAVVNPSAASGGDDNSNKGFDAQEHFSYQARIVSGGTIAPSTTRPW